MKFVTVISKKIPLGQALNVASHMMAGLVSTQLEETKLDMGIINYGENAQHHIASKWPHIMLKAKNSNKIKKLVEAANTSNIPHVTFVSTMIEGGWEAQLERTRATDPEENEYLGVSLFRDSKTLSVLTDSFSLYI